MLKTEIGFSSWLWRRGLINTLDTMAEQSDKQQSGKKQTDIADSEKKSLSRQINWIKITLNKSINRNQRYFKPIELI